METAQKSLVLSEYAVEKAPAGAFSKVGSAIKNKDCNSSLADEIFHEIEGLSVMTKSEDLKWNEDVLWIWGFKFPSDSDLGDKVIHHTLLEVNNLANKESFRIVYFHSDVKGTGNKIPKLIKKMCKKMSKDMRKKLTSVDIVHSNFSLKWSLFFFDILSLTNYKINFKDSLDALFIGIDAELKTFILGVLPTEIRLYDSQRPTPSTSIVGVKKQFTKDVLSTSNEKYKEFDATQAVQTYEIFGKHISEFPREEGESVPEVFTLIFEYFQQNEQFMQKEGIFRLAGNTKLLKEIEENICKGNYGFLAEVEDPITVAVFLKKILREMGEPLCTFDAYCKFKDINDEKCSCTEEKVDVAHSLVESLPELNRETFKSLLRFLKVISENQVQNKMKINSLAIVFAPNLFKGFEVTPNDMIYAQVLVKTLTLMIANYSLFD